MIYWTGAATRLGWDGATFSGTFSGGIRYSTAANDVDKDNERNGTAPLTPHSAAMLQETVMTMTTTIASPVMIESTGANTTVLVPHGAELPPPPPLPAVDLPASSANTPMHPPLNATDAPPYACLSLVKDGGTTVPTASLPSAAASAPVATSTTVATAPPPPPPLATPLPTTLPTVMMPSATPKTSFVKLNFI